ncbi:LCP family protein [Texcoconibacillus texcoconensis]|uniref:LCP family protein required for cell wall assembly n=1 Tax=Texcoconibacillus texcoconensis TaxID=1095777 RepID=A0A840QR25_9BACI|nr:LCP family protein [Texcoconibacillus texcoconensis]MBB5173773.1 LCP family protein required for cell wall assembly [Texcoconibacillus texcoconensis]
MSYSRREYKKRQQRRRKGFKKWAVRGGIALFVFLLVLGVGFGYMWQQFEEVTSGAQQELDRGDRSDMREEAVNPSQDSISILFLGVDDRTGNLRGRTDAIVLATFNAEDQSVKMLNIPRDSLVNIPGRGQDKINHAHAFGGIDLAIETVEDVLDIPVDYFMTLNFMAFMEVVDELGGVEVDSPFEISEMDSYDNPGAIWIPEGEQTLNGEEALAYVRHRQGDPQGDIGRGERQKEVLESLIRESASLSSITSFGSVMESLENHMKTNLTFNNIVSLHGYARNFDEITSLSLDGHGLRTNRWYYQLDEESLNETSHRLRIHLGLEDEAGRNVMLEDEE